LKKILFVFYLLITFSVFSQEEKRLALVIGNANYEKGELKNPVNDARLIASTLDSLDFDVILKENLESQSDFKKAILEFGKKRPEYDVAFVYYAGHGIQISDKNYLLPTKVEFSSEDEVEMFGVSVQDIMRYLKAQTNEVNILILDACRDNPFESNWNKTRSLKGGGLAKIPPPTGSLIAFSTDSGQTAPDGDGKNSIYTTSLSKNMLLKESSIDQVFRTVRSEVLNKTDGIQRPVEATQLTGETFYLVKRNYDSELKKADILINQNKFDEAIFILETIYKSDTNNLDIVSLLSKAYTLNGNTVQNNFKKAYNLLNKYIPNSINKEMLNDRYVTSTKISELFYRKSRLLMFMKYDWESIFLNLEMSIKYDPKNPYYDYYYATIYFDDLYTEVSENERNLVIKTRYKNAIDKYLKKIENENNNASLYFYLGFSYYNIKEYEKAYINWNKALELDPENIYYYAYITNKYAKQGRFKEGLKIINKSIEICKNCTDSYLSRGFINYNLNNFDNAINDYSAYYNFSENENDKNIRGDRGSSYFENAKAKATAGENELAYDNYKNAIEDYTHTIKYLNKNNSNNDLLNDCLESRAYIYYLMASVENDLDLDFTISLEKSNIDYKSLINKGFFGENIEFVDRYLNNDFLSGNYNDLIQNAKTIIEKYSERFNSNERSSIFTMIGMTYWTINNNDKALEYYKKALDLNNSAENFNQYAVALSLTGDNENALYYFNKSIELKPEYSLYIYNRGYYYYQIKDYDNAEKDFKKTETLLEDFDLDNSLMLMKISVKKNDFKNQLFYANRILEEGLSSSSNYWLSEIYLNQKRYLKSIIFVSKVIDEKKSGRSNAFTYDLVSYEDYDNTIPEDSEIITLPDLYIKRGNLFKIIGNELEACEDYNKALLLIEEESELNTLKNKMKEVKSLMLENCN